MKLQATVLPQNATDKTVAYTTDAEGITVSADGLVSWTDETPFGTYVVTATTVNGLTDEFELTLAGRNLIKVDTSDWRVRTATSAWDVWTISTVNRIDLPVGSAVVGQVEISNYSNDSVGVRANIRWYSEDNLSNESFISEENVSNSNGYFKKGNEGIATIKGKVPEGANYCAVILKKQDGNTSVNCEWRHVKLEQGNVATPYTVAPEDL